MSERRPLIIWGAGGHAAVVAEIVSLARTHRVVGFVDDLNSQEREFAGFRVLGDRSVIPSLRTSGVEDVIIAVGDCAARLKLAREATALGFRLISAVHPRAIVSESATIAAGSVIAAGAVVSVNTEIGMGAIINTLASVDHDCRLGDSVHIAPGAHLAGSARVGAVSLIGIGAVVKDHVSIGCCCVIGAGAAVIGDIPDHSVAYGVPARVVRRLSQ